MLLLGAAGFVLLIACGNAANLFLARATVRRREMAMQVVLEVSRGRVLRQMLTESLLLSVGAGVVGLMLTLATVRLLVGLCPADIRRLQKTRIDVPVLGFTLRVSVLTGLLFGMLPAWRASDVSVGETLKEGAGRTTTGGRWRRLHRGLVVSQLGLSLILLIGATLLIRSLIALTSVELGFEPDKVPALYIELPEAKYAEEKQSDASSDRSQSGSGLCPALTRSRRSTTAWGSTIRWGRRSCSLTSSALGGKVIRRRFIRLGSCR